MFYKMKMLSLKSASVRILILIMAGVMGVLIFYEKTLDYFMGPEEMAVSSFKYEKGKYVKYDLDDIMVMDCFLERKDQTVRGDIITYYYYILGIKDDESNTLRCVVVMTESDKTDIYNDYNRYLKNRIKGKSYETPKPYSDKGKLISMDSLVKYKFAEYMDKSYGISYKGNVYCEPYCIIPYEPGIFDISVCFVSCFFILAAIAEFIIICSGLKQRKLKKYFSRTGREGITAVEKDYQYSRFFSNSIRIGDKYTYLFFSESIRIIENKKIMWIYECTAATQPGRGVKSNAGYSGIEVWDREFNCYEIYSYDKKMINSILDYMVKQFPYVIVGYNQMLSNLYFNDNSQFKNLVYSKYSEQNEQDGGSI